MSHHPLQPPGEGPLTFGLIVRQAWGMFRLGYVRVGFVALLLFVPPAFLSAALQRLVESQPNLVPGFSTLLALAVAALFRLLGPVVFAGYLDEAVGSEYFHGRRHRLGEVLRTLPWISLLVADVVVVLGATAGLALFVVPGLVFYVLFGLVGPVIVQEHRGVRDAFGRTFRISRTAVFPIIVLVVVPLVAEQVIHGLAHEAVRGEDLPVQMLLEWLIAAVVGGMVGLLEVALATELMARNPEPAVGRTA